MDAAAQFKAASREELAKSEESEVSILEEFLPPALLEADVDRLLAEAVAEVSASADVPPNALLGKVLKSFWTKAPVGTGSISGSVVTQKAKELLAQVS